MNKQNIHQAMAHNIIEYLESRRDKNEENFLKVKPKKNKQGIVTNGAIIERFYVLLDKHLTCDTSRSTLTQIKKSKKLKDQSKLEYQQQKLNQLADLINSDDFGYIKLKTEYNEFVIRNNSKHDPVNWLNDWTAKAKDISFATHVGKLTHSSSKSSSVLDTTQNCNDRYLTSNRLAQNYKDKASANAASLPIADILDLQVDNISLLDLLKNGDSTVFYQITQDQSLVDHWVDNLKQSFDSPSKKSHFLSKQIYFPVGPSEYHLLMPLKSSSLGHAIHLEQKKRWDEDKYKQAFEQKNKGKYSSTILSVYPKKAIIHITASNHSNASSLNGKRGGKLTLMSALPPQWVTKQPSYKNESDIFTKKIAFALKAEIEELSSYLLLLKRKKLSVSQPNRNAAILRKLRALSSQFFYFIDSINDAENEKGWTEFSELKLEYQLLFEPWRDDKLAKSKKTNLYWQESIAKDFGRWLNLQINKNKQLNLTPIQAGLWSEYFKIELREYIAIKEVSI